MNHNFIFCGNIGKCQCGVVCKKTKYGKIYRDEQGDMVKESDECKYIPQRVKVDVEPLDEQAVILISIYNEMMQEEFEKNSVSGNLVEMTRGLLIRNGHKHRLKQ